MIEHAEKSGNESLSCKCRIGRTCSQLGSQKSQVYSGLESGGPMQIMPQHTNRGSIRQPQTLPGMLQALLPGYVFE